ncbi:MAG: HlyD family secretion protein [Oscillospiraceae bacterium]|nr:HlyD family secretion protein [Oscillospiraceae bacterium]
MKKAKSIRKYKELITIMISLWIAALLITGCDIAIADDLQSIELEPTTSANPEVISAPHTTHTSRITVRGIVESTTSRNVYTTLGHFIDTVEVEIGDRVTKGQVLVTLDTEVLELTIAQARAQIEATRLSAGVTIEETQRMLDQASSNISNNTNAMIINAQAALRGAEANLAAIQNNYDAARSDSDYGNNAQILAAQTAVRNARMEWENREADLDNAKVLYEIDAISRQELRNAQDAFNFAVNQLDDAEAAYDNAVLFQQRNLEQLRLSLEAANTAQQQAQRALNAAGAAARQEVEALRGSVEIARISANLEAQEIALKILERQLADSKIIAPINGTITSVVAREGMIGSGLLLTIEDTDNLHIITRFREYDIAQIREGMEVSISTNGSEAYSGVIARINPAATITPGTSIVEFEAEIAVTSESTGLRIGMTTRVNIELKR